MKKIYSLLASIVIVFVAIIACEKSSIELDELQETELEEIFSKKTDKVRLCHGDEQGGYITQPIAQSAAKAHLAHGDKYVYSPKEVWTVHKYNPNNGSLHIWDIDVNTFDGTNFSGIGTYNLVWGDISYPTSLRTWGTVDNSTGIMDINIEWDTTSHPTWPWPSKKTWQLAGTSCMCSGIFEIHSTSATIGPHQFSLDQDTSVPCVTY